MISEFVPAYAGIRISEFLRFNQEELSGSYCRSGSAEE